MVFSINQKLQLQEIEVVAFSTTFNTPFSIFWYFSFSVKVLYWICCCLNPFGRQPETSQVRIKVSIFLMNDLDIWIWKIKTSKETSER